MSTCGKACQHSHTLSPAHTRTHTCRMENVHVSFDRKRGSFPFALLISYSRAIKSISHKLNTFNKIIIPQTAFYYSNNRTKRANRQFIYDDLMKWCVQELKKRGELLVVCVCVKPSILSTQFTRFLSIFNRNISVKPIVKRNSNFKREQRTNNNEREKKRILFDCDKHDVHAQCRIYQYLK